MFTGIIESVGIVTKIVQKGTNKTFWISSPVSKELKVDQSVSHNGVCLTVEEIDGNSHRVTAIQETLEKSNLNNWHADDKVNIERCLQFNGRLDGHMVQGHVDTTGLCTDVEEQIGSKLRRLQRDFPEVDIEPIKEKLATLGIYPENLYLFLRGHDLFETVVAIGRRVCEKLMEMKKRKVIPDNHKISVIFGQSHDFESHVKHNFSFGKYPEINKIGDDIRRFYAE